jgi:quinolinate synthase
MADMAHRSQVDRAWAKLKEWTSDTIIPITYINCAADLKAFVGENEGSICTSSNAKKIITWALERGDKLFFFPDQHLGRNTCFFDLGISLDQMVVYHPQKKDGGLTADQIKKAKIILWYGHCSVHQGFKTEHINFLRTNSPETKIIVHPECSFEVVRDADLFGSTSFIVNHLEKAAPGSSFAIGTEVNLVNRLKKRLPHLHIQSLSPYQCLCTTMYRVRPRWLLNSLRSIQQNKPINQVKVGPEITHQALKALDTMMNLSFTQKAD